MFALPVVPLAVILVLAAVAGVVAAVRPARRAARWTSSPPIADRAGATRRTNGGSPNVDSHDVQPPAAVAPPAPAAADAGLRPDGPPGRRSSRSPRSIALLATSAGLLITFVLALPFAWLLFVWSRAMGHVERSRVDALMDVRIADPVPPLRTTGLAAPARRAGHVRAAVEGDRLPPRPPPGRRHRLRPDDGGVGRLDRHGAPAGLRRRAARRLGEVLLLRDHRGRRRRARRDRRHRRPRARRPVDHGRRSGRMELALARALLGPSAEAGARRPGHPAGDEPHGGRRQRRGRAPPHRARPPRRRPAAPRRAGGQPRCGTREARPRRHRGGTDDGGRRPRGGEVGVEGDPRPRARHPPGDPRGPRPRRRAVGGRRPLADPGHARRRRRRRARRRRSRARRTSSSTRR